MVQAEPVIYVRDGDLGILVDRVGVVGVVGIVRIVGVIRIVRNVWNVGVVRVVRNVGVIGLFRLLRQILRRFFRRFGDVIVLLRVDQDLRLRCVRVSGHCLRNDGSIGGCCIGFIPRLFLDAACGAKYDQ